MRRPLVSVVFAFTGLVAGAASCGSDAQFNVRSAEDFAAHGHTVSVFGVFKDGRMNPEAWDQLGVRLSAPLGAPRACETAYTNDRVALAPELFGAVDNYARANGVTDELVDRFSGAAKGDTIMVITVAGHPPQPIGDGGAPPSRSAPPAAGGRGMGGMRGGRGGPSSYGGSSGGGARTDQSVFEMSASLFSVKQHHSVALIEMTYSGPTVDDALQKFAARLKAELPAASCAGWSWETPIDEESVRQLHGE